MRRHPGLLPARLRRARGGSGGSGGSGRGGGSGGGGGAGARRPVTTCCLLFKSPLRYPHLWNILVSSSPPLNEKSRTGRVHDIYAVQCRTVAAHPVPPPRPVVLMPGNHRLPPPQPQHSRRCPHRCRQHRRPSSPPPQLQHQPQAARHVGLVGMPSHRHTKVLDDHSTTIKRKGRPVG